MTEQTPLVGKRLFWLAWVAAVCVFGVMCGFAAVADRFPGDLTIARHIQDLDDVHFGPLASFANTAGDTLWGGLITVAFAVAFLLLRRLPESAVVILTFVPRGLRQVLAMIVARPRPSADLLQIRHHASGYSFPSGHATGVMALYGALFVLAGALIPQKELRLLFRVLCVFMIVTTGVARVYVGVHWPSDVIGGYLFGIIALAPIFCLCGYAFRRVSSQRALLSRHH